MPTDLILPSQLTTAQITAWRDLQRVDASCDSPFLSPTFTKSVADVRPDVAVAVLRRDGEDIGFFPFQRTGRKTGRPVGWKLNDFQGAVVSGRIAIDAAEVLRGANLAAWHFDHLVPGQAWCGARQQSQRDSPFINLADGFESYLKAKTDSKSRRLKTVLRKSRKLVREVGPLRFEFDCCATDVFDRLLEWKGQQLGAMRSFNVFRFEWARQLLDVLWTNDEPECRGTLSALWAGDELLAAHYGIRNESVLHWWVTSYHQEFERYSPGSILLLELLRSAAGQGLIRIDLGKGDEAYKQSFQTGAVVVSEGAVARSALRSATLRAAYRVRDTVRSSCLEKPARWVKQSIRGLFGHFPAAGTCPANSSSSTAAAAAAGSSAASLHSKSV